MHPCTHHWCPEPWPSRLQAFARAVPSAWTLVPLPPELQVFPAVAPPHPTAPSSEGVPRSAHLPVLPSRGPLSPSPLQMFKLLAKAYADVHPMMMDKSENRCGGNFLKKGSVINGADWYSFTGGAAWTGGGGAGMGRCGAAASSQQLLLGTRFWRWGEQQGCLTCGGTYALGVGGFGRG